MTLVPAVPLHYLCDLCSTNLGRDDKYFEITSNFTILDTIEVSLTVHFCLHCWKTRHRCYQEASRLFEVAYGNWELDCKKIVSEVLAGEKSDSTIGRPMNKGE